MIFEKLPIDKSIQFAKMYEFAAYLLINAQRDSNSLDRARMFLENSQRILQKIPFFGDDVITTHVRAAWLAAVTYRQQGNLNKGFAICEEVVRELAGVVSFEILVSIFREMAILEQSENSFHRILKDDIEYRGNFVEVFHTHRRYFEFLLKRRLLRKAEAMLPKLKSSFFRVSKVVESVYVATYQKDLYHYFRLIGDHKKSEYFFKIALNKTEKLGLFGQAGALMAIKNELDKEGLQ